MPDFMAFSGRVRHTKVLSMQTITIQGFIIDTLICENQSIPKEFQQVCLNNEGRIILPYRNIDDKNFNIQAFEKRFQEASVKDFYAKYD
ncbi:MAG: hypothetical protein ACXV8O_17390 [Methylobacter sp.]